MIATHPSPTGNEISFSDDEIIVSKTDPRGIITYANHVFERVSGYSQAELIGTPHNILRHPEMPRCVFRLLWDTIKSGREIFAYVNNLARNGDHYWVFAHVTPSYDAQNRLVGYHSNRRVPYFDALAAIRPVYARLLAEERGHSNPGKGMEAGTALLSALLKERGMSYSQFVFSLSSSTTITSTAA